MTKRIILIIVNYLLLTSLICGGCSLSAKNYVFGGSEYESTPWQNDVSTAYLI
jgi:hypothetical protein